MTPHVMENNFKKCGKTSELLLEQSQMKMKIKVK